MVAAAKLAVVAGAAAMAKRGELRERWRSKLGRGGVAKKTHGEDYVMEVASGCHGCWCVAVAGRGEEVRRRLPWWWKERRKLGLGFHE